MLIHKACPGVHETIKWGFPSFDYKGPFVSVASFKEHAVFGFWKAKLLNDPNEYLSERSNEGGEAMGHFGRITKLSDLPPDKALIDFIKQAKKLNDDGVKLPSKPKKEQSPLKIPPYFTAALKKNKMALATFENFSYSNKKEYVMWITEAKTETTRGQRLALAVEWMAEGKIRNWKYLKK
jgi:uncharacterized protein YdeI (YjbR/CyaY-like superfamily)